MAKPAFLLALASLLGVLSLSLVGFDRPGLRAAELSPAKPSYAVQGDSLSVMSRSQLKRALPGWKRRSFSAKVGRQYWTGMDLIKHQRLGRVVVFALGTNSWQSDPSAWRAAIRRLLVFIGPRRCLVMATIYDQRPITSFNRVLRSEARRAGPSRFQLAGWAALVSSGKVRLSDGVHPASSSDIASWAHLIARASRRCILS